MAFRLALIGFGGVNQGLVELLKAKQDMLQKAGLPVSITAVADLRLGLISNPQGIGLDALLDCAANGFSTDALQHEPGTTVQHEIDLQHTLALISADYVDVVVEATFTDPNSGEPALSHCRAALTHGKHVITTNKGPIALAQRSLAQLATEHGVQLKYEGAVMSGTPVLRQISTTLRGCDITGFAGILNGTSNYVLERLAQGHEFDAAVKEAQALGYAEANPAADLEGADVQLKVVILANTLWDAGLTRADVPCRGISGLTGSDIRAARTAGDNWKLVGSASRHADGTVSASVEPRQLPAGHSLHSVAGVSNAISFETDVLGNITISGPGAGRVETAFAILSDLIELAEQAQQQEACA
ncbi:homoserine dehydrogenase [Vogesella sp. LIG4]|uniref:homoserine dehydrogenase n=1 Tax=Vogesella sp. LIG4 TaxID=1192162 RepID=UPI00082018F1|nr:homoserine dehydrogenase [Vogesella sp. LIG4]SCK27288.1 homoserine dehydrogenase [Vogesella sp. LIG4]